MSQIGERMDYPITCIGIPKTVDNDLPITDNCPGFGSVAKYVAVSVREAAFDVRSMARSSTKVFILEVMGRHAGWIAAAGGLAAEFDGDAPHIIVFPEIAFDEERFLERVGECVDGHGYCVVVVSEGARYADGRFLSDSGTRDAFGHAQLGGVAPVVAEMIRARHGYKFHWAVADYLQRAARHIASGTDVEQAYAMGRGRRRVRACRQERRHAGGRSRQRRAVRLGGGRGAARRGRQRGEEGAARLHHGGRLRHHGGRPELSPPAHRRRGLSPVRGRSSRLRAAEERAGSEKLAAAFEI